MCDSTRYFRATPARELKNEENLDWVTKQLKKALAPKDREAVEIKNEAAQDLIAQ